MRIKTVLYLKYNRFNGFVGVLNRKAERPAWTWQPCNGANKRRVLHVRLGCGSLSITTPVSLLGHTWFTCSDYAFYSGQAQSSIREQLCKSCSEYTTVRGGVVGVERSRDQTKMAERLNGIETFTKLSFKTRNSYRNSVSKTISCFESLSD